MKIQSSNTVICEKKWKMMATFRRYDHVFFFSLVTPLSKRLDVSSSVHHGLFQENPLDNATI